ncbi:MAG: M15 family metallopeptidase [Clostridia bacterium]|jgi:D-alanyl-D-alanine carboxypeptidase|nr:M15 family metallopeptidase [Clostridia bacterium]
MKKIIIMLLFISFTTTSNAITLTMFECVNHMGFYAKTDKELSEALEEIGEELEIADNDIEEEIREYIEDKYVVNPDDILVLVNKDSYLPVDYEPSDLVEAHTKCYGVNNKLRKIAADNMKDLVEAAMEESEYELILTSCYRSYGYQERLFGNYVKRSGLEKANTYSARPGESEHQTGLVADITTIKMGGLLKEEFGDTEEGIWLANNAHKYGFIIRYLKGKEDITGYQYEPWHIRYVGKEVATYIYENNITLEEYLYSKEIQDKIIEIVKMLGNVLSFNDEV